MQKVIVITGASGGIGAALARQQGAQGNLLVLAARREAELRQVAQASHPRAVAVVTDVTRRAEVERLRDRAIEAFGRVDVWVNNAGRGITRPVLDLSDEDLDTMISVNLKSALYGMQAIAPHFKSRGEGHVINVSSVLGRVPMLSTRSAYNAAKHALNALTANLRVELRATHPRINVSLVMPGIVLTEFAANALGGTPAFAFRPGAASSARAQTGEEVAKAIGDLIENPAPEIYTTPACKDLVRRYYDDVAAFEAAASAPPKG